MRFERGQCQADLAWMSAALLASDARQDRAWMRIVKAAIREPEEMRAALAALPDTPEWAAKLLQTPNCVDGRPDRRL
jgi:hypothetical protein